jgi:uncharacterized membrane protein
MAYKVLGTIPFDDVLERLEGTPLHAELIVCPKRPNGNYAVSNDLAQRIDDFLFQHKQRMYAPIHAAQAKEQQQKFQNEMRELAAKERTRVQHVNGYKARLQQYFEVGLLDTEKNAKLIADWFTTNVKGFVSATGLDVAVAFLRSQLDWYKPAPPPKPQPKPKPWSPESGEPLPLAATEEMLRQASVAQVKDWVKRKRSS